MRVLLQREDGWFKDMVAPDDAAAAGHVAAWSPSLHKFVPNLEPLPGDKTAHEVVYRYTGESRFGLPLFKET